MKGTTVIDGKKIIGVIPARIGSTRLARKALLEIKGIPMVGHVFLRSKMSEVLDELCVATDNREIFDYIRSIGGNAVMTSEAHSTGIERVEEATRDLDYDLVVLINGDEPALNPTHIAASVRTLLDTNAPTALLASRSNIPGSKSDFKVVVNKRGEAMYFSREDIPSPSRSGVNDFLKAYHVISFKKDCLREYVHLERTPMERAEGHDHLRFLEHGIKVQIGIVDYQFFSVDTLEDLESMRDLIGSDEFSEKYL